MLLGASVWLSKLCSNGIEYYGGCTSFTRSHSEERAKVHNVAQSLRVLSTIYVQLALTVYDLAEEAVGDS